MRKFKLLSVIAILFLFTCCRKPVPELASFDETGWKEDKQGCNGTRTGMLESLNSQKEKLLALTEMEIVSMLGRPDQNELYKRNQKFYFYFITPSKNCGTLDTSQTRLAIRFNAMGIAKEIRIE